MDFAEEGYPMFSKKAGDEGYPMFSKKASDEDYPMFSKKAGEDIDLFAKWRLFNNCN